MDASILKLLDDLQLVSNRILTKHSVASVALLVYDYTLTFSKEVNHVWTSAGTLMRCILLLQRYLPLVDNGAVLLLRHFIPHPSNKTCRVLYSTTGWMSSGGIALSEMVLTTRVWAIWGRGKIFGTLLLVFFLGCWAPSILVQYKLIQSVQFAQSMPIVNERGCLVESAKPYAWICWGLLMVYEGGLLLLMIFSCLKNCLKSATKGKLAKIVYTDGILYYMYLFGLSLINLVVILCFPGSVLVDLLGSLERVMYPILTSRVIFHIRAHTSASTSGRGSMGRHYPIPASSTSALHTLQLQEGDMVQHDVHEDGIGIAL
ncbi:hypothetical protein PM082_008259 [Marasmius tenuissimus]|nr:hypothetical protein PM082_008259 [Marasmius tenuissimus]